MARLNEAQLQLLKHTTMYGTDVRAIGLVSKVRKGLWYLRHPGLRNGGQLFPTLRQCQWELDMQLGLIRAMHAADIKDGAL